MGRGDGLKSLNVLFVEDCHDNSEMKTGFLYAFRPIGIGAIMRATLVSPSQCISTASRLRLSPHRDQVQCGCLLLVLALGGNDLARASDDHPATHAATLRKHDVEPNATGLRKYLRQFCPNTKGSPEALQLVQQLGSSKFRERESASKQLMASAVPPLNALQDAAASSDLEVRYRARMILAVLAKRQLRTMYSALKMVEHETSGRLTA